MTVPLSDFCRSPRELLLLHNLLRHGSNTLGTVERNLSCIRRILISTNYEAWTFSFLAASFPFGKVLDLRYAIKGVVQLSSAVISCICAQSSINEEVWIKDNTCSDAFINSAEASFARWSAHSFPPLGFERT